MHIDHVEAGTAARRATAERSGQAALWQAVEQCAETEQERAILLDSFAYGLSPRSILARHPDLFADVRAVYTAKRDLLGRIEHSCVLRALRPI